MAVYNLSPIFQPQFIGNAAAALVFASGGTVVPAGFNYQITVARVSNITNNTPTTLKVWRVPNGSVDDGQHIVCPTITVPIPSQTFPYFDLTALWGVVLQPGDAIWALAGSAGILTIHADGLVIQP